MVGLLRGTVRVDSYHSAWAEVAREHCERIRCALGDDCLDVQHVGSTSVPGLAAKPIIDIAVAIADFTPLLISRLESVGYIYRPSDEIGQWLFVQGQGEMRSAHIHLVKYMSMEWRNYLNFRDYLRTFPNHREEYQQLKLSLAEKYPLDRETYTKSKAEFIQYTLRKAMVWSYIGKQISAEIDRPVGYLHCKGNKQLLYPINYGFIPGVLGGDGEELDVYCLGCEKPVKTFEGKVIAIVHRADDVEDKLVACDPAQAFSLADICNQIYFQEKYYDSTVELYDGERMHVSAEEKHVR